MAGESAVNALASAIGCVYRLEHQGAGFFTAQKQRGGRATNRDIENTLAAHPGIRGSVNAAKGVGRLLGSQGLAIALHYLMSKTDKDTCDLFFLNLEQGTGLRQRDPVYHLREYLLRQKTKKAKMPLQDRIYAVIKTWNLTRANKQCDKHAIIWYGGKDEAPPEKSSSGGRGSRTANWTPKLLSA